MRFAISALAVLVLSAMVFADEDLLLSRWSLGGMNVKAQYRRGAVAFEFPAAPSSVSLLIATAPSRFTLAGRVTVTAQIDATDGATFNYQTEPWNTCVNPATARPYFEVDRWRQNHRVNTEYYRWWSRDVAIVLTKGLATVTVPLIPSAWSNVNGQRGDSSPAATEGFAWARGQVDSIGLTFGGGCFFGHGVNMTSGSASFTLLAYTVAQ